MHADGDLPTAILSSTSKFSSSHHFSLDTMIDPIFSPREYLLINRSVRHQRIHGVEATSNVPPVSTDLRIPAGRSFDRRSSVTAPTSMGS